MNTKRYNLMIMIVVSVILLTTPAFARIEHVYVPAGVWIPRSYAEAHDQIKTTCDSKDFDLFAGLGEVVTVLPKAVGNMLGAIFPDHEQETEMKVSQAIKYRDIRNASGVIVRFPAQ